MDLDGGVTLAADAPREVEGHAACLVKEHSRSELSSQADVPYADNMDKSDAHDERPNSRKGTSTDHKCTAPN